MAWSLVFKVASTCWLLVYIVPTLFRKEFAIVMVGENDLSTEKTWVRVVIETKSS